MTKVPWVTGRRKALVRAVAMGHAQRAGYDWLRLAEYRRETYLKEAEELVTDWVKLGVLATFEYDYREKLPELPDPVTGK